MKIIELIMDDTDVYGVDAMSLVESPAIGEHFITLAKQEQVEVVRFAADKKRKVLLGAALIPNLPIYRNDDKHGDFYVFMSKETVRKSAERYLRLGLQHETTLEHESKLSGCAVIESWIKEGEHDKTMNFGMDLPDGTWVIAMQASDEVWDEYIETGKVKGFSIEAGYVDRMKVKQSEDLELTELTEMVENLEELVIKAQSSL